MRAFKRTQKVTSVCKARSLPLLVPCWRNMPRQVHSSMRRILWIGNNCSTGMRAVTDRLEHCVERFHAGRACAFLVYTGLMRA